MFSQATLIFFVEDLAYSKENIGWLNIINQLLLNKTKQNHYYFCIFITVIST